MGMPFRIQMLILLAPSVLVGQKLSIDHQVRLIVGKGETLKINSDSLHIDTLLMYDDSRIVFQATSTKLIVENAFIGNNCLFDLAGEIGANGKRAKNELSDFHLQGLDGQSGRGLDVIILFRALGRLTINTSGGKGGNGLSGTDNTRRQFGSNPDPRQDRGGDGYPGGNGGHGGALTLLYACDGFLPVFNEKRNHSIVLQTNGGKGGNGGNGGKGAVTGPTKSQTGYSGVPGKDGLNGLQGKSGDDGSDGLLVLKRLN